MLTPKMTEVRSGGSAYKGNADQKHPFEVIEGGSGSNRSPWRGSNPFLDTSKFVSGHSKTQQRAASRKGGSIMSNPTREEVAAQFEATEARIETKLVSLEGKFDLTAAKIDNALSQIASSQKVAQETAKRAETAATNALAANISNRWNVLFIALAVVGTVIAMFAFGAQMFSIASSLIQSAKM